jgi:hypothetical protein
LEGGFELWITFKAEPMHFCAFVEGFGLVDARAAGWFLGWVFAVCAEHAAAHAAIAGKMDDWHALQAQAPGGEQVEGAVPGKVVEAAGGFEEGYRAGITRGGGQTGNAQSHVEDASVVEVAGQAAFDFFGVEVFEGRHGGWGVENGAW